MKWLRAFAKKWNLSFAAFVVAGLVPILATLAFSLVSLFQTHTFGSLFQSSRHFTLLMNSLRLASFVTIYCIAVGLPSAFLVFKTDVPFGRIFSGIFALSLLIPPYIGAISYTRMLSDDGILRGLFAFIGVPSYLIPQAQGFIPSVFVLGSFLFPVVFFFTGSALSSIDSKLEESMILAKGIFNAVWDVDLALCMDGLMVGSLIVFLMSLSDFGVSSFLFYDTYSIDIYSQLASFQNLGSASLYSLVFFAISIYGLKLYWDVSGGRPFQSVFSNSASQRYSLGFYRMPALLFLVFVSLSSPIIYIVSLSKAMTYLHGEYVGLNNIYWVFSTAWENVMNSLMLSTASTFLMLVMGFSISMWSFRSNVKKRVELSLLFPFIIPGAVFSLWLIGFYNKNVPFFYSTMGIMVVAFVVKYLILSYKVFENAFSKVSTSLLDATELVDKSWWERNTRIYVPMLLPHILASILLSYLFTLRDLSTALMIYPPGSATLPISIFILYHDGPPGLVSALSVVFISLTLFPVAVIYLISKLYQK